MSSYPGLLWRFGGQRTGIRSFQCFWSGPFSTRFAFAFLGKLSTEGSRPKNTGYLWFQFVIGQTFRVTLGSLTSKVIYIKLNINSYNFSQPWNIVWVKMNNNNKMAILELFLAIFLPTVCLSFTKPRFRRSFLGA